MLIYGQDDLLLPWAAERIGLGEFRKDATAIGQEKDGQIVAVVVYDCFTPVECSVHIASDGSRRWLNKEFLAASFAYPFMQCRFESITGLVQADNADALRFDMHIGWKTVGVRHKAAPGGKDIVILEMLRADCRWIPEDYRK